MSQKTLRDAAGKALYLEFRKGFYTTQIIFTPVAVGLDGKVIGAQILKRVISPSHPRKTWSFTRVLGENVARPELSLARDADGNFIKQSYIQARELVAHNLSWGANHALRDMARGSWVLYKKPMAVEISFGELEDIKNTKTPNSLVRRVLRARTGLGWGESLFNEAPLAV